MRLAASIALIILIALVSKLNSTKQTSDKLFYEVFLEIFHEYEKIHKHFGRINLNTNLIYLDLKKIMVMVLEKLKKIENKEAETKKQQQKSAELLMKRYNSAINTPISKDFLTMRYL